MRFNPQTIKHGTALVKEYGRQLMWQRAIEVLSEAQHHGLEPGIITFTACIAACSSSRHWVHAMSLLHDMQHRGLQPDVMAVTSVMGSALRGKQWRRSLDLFTDMQTKCMQPGVVAFATAVSACRQGQQPQMAKLLKAQITLEIYNASISECVRNYRWRQALSFFFEMQTQRFVPDTATYSYSILACEKGELWRYALHLLRRSFDLASPASSASCAAVMNATVHANLWSRALILCMGDPRLGCHSRFAYLQSSPQRL